MIRRIALSAVLVSAIALMGVSPVGAGEAAPDPNPTGNTYLIAYMTGGQERPGPGDPDAFGRAIITIRDDINQLCVTMWWANVDGTPSGFHIHLAPPGSPGPIVIPFATPAPGSRFTYQCVTVANEALLDNIATNPQQYYINLHTTPLYPGGALRGQLQFL